MTRTFFNRKAHIWDEDHSERDAAKLREMTERLGIEPGATLLDVGSGTGVFLPMLLSKVGKGGRLFALDSAEEMLKRARSKPIQGEVYYLQADVSAIPIQSGVFDVVVCYSSFPHFQDKPGALSEMNRVTKDGGRLFICHTSSRDQINDVHSQIPTLEQDVIPDKGDMQRLLRDAGFNEITIADGEASYLARARKVCRGKIR
ncbi:MAG TPA: methyltransferase domain-containing protein [Dehalococcoidia bacterium]|nr:methyltransferase domain-containing protein [Dehalococcoidia bacterium]